MAKVLGWTFKITGALALFGLLAGIVAVAAVGGLMALEDQPRDADAIVVLGGGYFRPLHAATLYTKGFAPEIYVVRPKPGPDRDVLIEAGLDIPPQEEIYRRLLLKRGVPESAVHFYGTGVQSTVEEATTFAAIVGDKPRTFIIVTSPYHVMRARMIFEQALPNATILATATPDEPFPKPWWSEQYGAVRVVNETAKLAWYLLGGRFFGNVSIPQPAAPAPTTN